MDYEDEIDLMTDVCVLDVDLPTFLNDYPLSADRSNSSGGGVVVNGDQRNVYKSNTVLNEIDHRNEIFSTEGANNFYLPESIFSNAASEYTVLTPAPLFQQHRFVDAPWHENFIDVENDDFSFLDIQQHSAATNELSFLENIVWQAETTNNVDDLLDIVNESSSSAVRDPQQIYEEISRECEELESRSDADSPPRFLTECEIADGESVVEVVEHYSPSRDDTEDESRDSTPFSVDDGSTTDASYNPDHSRLAWNKYQKKSTKRDRGDLAVSMKKKSQNRVAASRYRSKKKSEKSTIEGELKVLTTKNQSLKSTVDDLEREVSYLKNFLNEIRQAKKINVVGVGVKKIDKRAKK